MNSRALIYFIFGMLLLANQARADNAAMKESLGAFFGVDAGQIWMECAADGYELKDDAGTKTLKVCLNKADKQKRCEFSIHSMALAPKTNKISYDINFGDPLPRHEFESVMQVHTFPDKNKGEQWRCPPVSFEVQNNTYRMYSRWDVTPVSKVSGYNCTEPGNSISSRPVMADIPVKAGQWQHVEFMSKLSLSDDGEIELKVGDKSSGVVKGPNTYNDERPPFVKFGIYKPTGWERGHETTCVQYRNVKIETGVN